MCELCCSLVLTTSCYVLVWLFIARSLLRQLWLCDCGCGAAAVAVWLCGCVAVAVWLCGCVAVAVWLWLCGCSCLSLHGKQSILVFQAEFKGQLAAQKTELEELQANYAQLELALDCKSEALASEQRKRDTEQVHSFTRHGA